jgi:hypothetical protein
MPSEWKQVLKTSGLINCFVDLINTGSHTHVVTSEVLTVTVPRIRVFMYSEDMNLVSLGQGFHASSRIMVPSACRVHQSGKNKTAGSLKTKASQSFQMSGTTHPVTMCQH